LPEHASEFVPFFQPPYFSFFSERKAEIPTAHWNKKVYFDESGRDVRRTEGLFGLERECGWGQAV
jgi:hypothetical protein